MSDRFVVTEIVGSAGLGVGGYRPQGLSCHVIDLFWNHRIMASFRSEQLKSYGHLRALERARELAAAKAAELNAQHVGEQAAA